MCKLGIGIRSLVAGILANFVASFLSSFVVDIKQPGFFTGEV
jgi:hypothetical protein